MSASRRSSATANNRRAARQPKSEPVWVEIPVLIHGITPQADPRGSTTEYNTLIEAVNTALIRQHKHPFSRYRIYVEWGWDSGQSKQPDLYLAEAERKIGAQMQAGLGAIREFSLNPLHLVYPQVRPLFLYGLPDLFYYLSEDGETALRNHIFEFVALEIRELMQSPDVHISLTLFGHSAGSIIAHDLLFHLFGKKDPKKSEGASLARKVDPVRELADQGRLRVRRLYTFGSPLLLVSMRSDSLVGKLVNGTPMQPGDLGLRASDGLSSPRWVNFWDQDDLISGPVAGLYAKQDQTVQDKHINVGWFFSGAHTSYWGSPAMTDYIAKTY